MDSPGAAHELELLLEHASWLSGLARHLVRDPAEAEEVVQETWLAALRGPRPARAGATRSWLAKVARNAARQRLRREGARPGVEQRGDAHGSARSAAELVERAQAQRLLVEGVIALAEPYREAILLRYFEDLSAAQIARQLGVPASTVRTRLARGLAELRGRLGDLLEGDSASLVVFLSPLVGADRGGSAAPPLADLSRWAPILGGSAVAVTGKLAIPAVLAIALGVYLSRQDGGEPVGPGVEPATESSAQVASMQIPDVGPGAPGPLPEEHSEREAVPGAATAPSNAQPEPEVAAEPAADAGGSILVRFRDESGSPVAGSVFLVEAQYVTEELRSQQSEHGLEGVRRLTCDVQGEARFEGLDRGTYSVAGLSSGGVWREAPWITIDWGMKEAVEELVIGGAVLHGSAWDAFGDPLPGMSLYILQRPSGNVTMAETGADGTYRAEGLSAEWTTVIVQEGGGELHQGRHEQPTIEVDGVQELNYGQPTPLARWRGVLRDAHGQIVQANYELSLTFRGGQIGQRSIPVQPDGSFDVPLEPGSYSVTVYPPDFYVPGGIEILSEDIDRDVTLGGTTLLGALSGADSGEAGAPRPGAVSVSIHPAGANHPGAFHSQTPGPDGLFRFYGLKPGRWEVSTYPQGLAEKQFFEIPEGVEEFEIRVEL